MFGTSLPEEFLDEDLEEMDDDELGDRESSCKVHVSSPDEMLKKLKLEVQKKKRNRRDQTFDKIQREINRKKRRGKEDSTKPSKDRCANNEHL